MNLPSGNSLATNNIFPQLSELYAADCWTIKVMKQEKTLPTLTLNFCRKGIYEKLLHYEMKNTNKKQKSLSRCLVFTLVSNKREGKHLFEVAGGGEHLSNFLSSKGAFRGRCSIRSMTVFINRGFKKMLLPQCAQWAARSFYIFKYSVKSESDKSQTTPLTCMFLKRTLFLNFEPVAIPQYCKMRKGQIQRLFSSPAFLPPLLPTRGKFLSS